jgi:hypothetical protein
MVFLLLWWGVFIGVVVCIGGGPAGGGEKIESIDIIKLLSIKRYIYI